MLDIIVILVIYILNLILISEFTKSRVGTKGNNFVILIYHYHVLIGFYYGWYAMGTDTSFYWNLGDRFRVFEFENWFDTYGTHNNFVFFINYPLSKILGLDFWTGTFLYSSLSAWAFVLLYISGHEMFKMDKVRFFGVEIWPYILFLPSLHFWSSGIGKDSLVFLFIAMFFYGVRDMRKFLIMVVISLLLLYHVRPHMAFIVIISAGFMLFSGSQIHFTYKIVFFTLSAIGLVLIYGEVLEFLRIEEVNAENLEVIFDKSSANLSYGKSFVDMSSYPLPFKLFTFWFRPLFFDAHNFSSLLNSIENFICLMISVKIFFLINPLKGYKIAPFHLKIMLWTFFIASIAFASALSNFGIMVRMKNMTFVYYLFFLVYIYDAQLWKEKLNKIRRMKYVLERREALRKSMN